MEEPIVQMQIGRFPKREFDDLTFEKFEKIDFLFFHFGKIHEYQ
jgi:hypothetical protein